MLSEELKKLSTISLEEVNNLSMEIARELVKEEFDMNNLAEIETYVMEMAQARMLELGCKFDKPEDFIWLGGLTVELSLYLGINIGRNLK